MSQPHSFSSREFLRALLVGKEVTVNVTHTLDASNQKTTNDSVNDTSHVTAMSNPVQAQNREFANLFFAPASPGQPPQEVSSFIISAGWARVRDGVGEGDEAVRWAEI